MDRRVSYVLEVLQRNGLRAKVEDLARKVSLSRNHLEVLFRREVGCSIKQFQMEQRLLRAAELLRDTHLQITEIGL